MKLAVRSSQTNSPGMYNSSKAALAAASETWRLELQPLGVRTITLMTCAVKTNFFSESNQPEIQETSPYFPIRKLVHEQGDGRMQAKAISAKQCTSQIVRLVKDGAVGTHWVGTDASMARLAFWLSPRWVLVSCVYNFDMNAAHSGAGHADREHHAFLEENGQSKGSWRFIIQSVSCRIACLPYAV